MNIRVITFNIQGGNTQGPNAWQRRADLITQVLQRYQPDLTGMQEVTVENLDFYRQRLPEYRQEAGPPTAPPPRHLYEAILWRPDVLHLLESGGFWLSETPDTYSLSWDSSEVRGANWLRLHHRGSGLEILHVNAHLDHISEDARREGSRTIVKQVERLRRGDEAVILTGDFNCNAYLPGCDVPPETAITGSAYRTFLDYGFSDAYLAGGGRDSYSSNTFHHYEGLDYQPNPQYEPAGWRIDWVMLLDPAQRLQPVSAAILRDHEGDLFPSDHYPVLVEFTLSTAAATRSMNTG
jgi:endonuclease/exonuclease/phosphatase family metal-dependent hydrolase